MELFYTADRERVSKAISSLKTSGAWPEFADFLRKSLLMNQTRGSDPLLDPKIRKGHQWMSTGLSALLALMDESEDLLRVIQAEKQKERIRSVPTYRP